MSVLSQAAAITSTAATKTPILKPYFSIIYPTGIDRGRARKLMTNPFIFTIIGALL